MPGGRAIYAMAAVERMIGESAETIRAWESRYRLPQPRRSPGGQQLYSRDDVERLRWVGRDLAAGRDPASRPGTRPPPEPPTDGPQILVLLAEPDPHAADLEEYFLRTEGYSVEVCSSAQDAEAGAAVMRPDIAVVELTLSGYAGLELCRRLREVSRTAVVAVSTLDREDEALAAGAEAFLLKPVDPLALISTIKDLLGASAYLRSGERD